MYIISTNRCRKWQVTINNPLEHGYTHEKIKEILSSFNYSYACFCDEVGAEGTPHIHIYICCDNAVSFDCVKNRFPAAHIEAAQGSSKQNRDYIRKEGKYQESDKKETNLIETFEEFGDLPLDKAEKNLKQSDEILQMIKDGCSDTEILDRYPSAYKSLSQIEQTRQRYLEEKFSTEYRPVKSIYIYGKTRTGKTRYVMDKYGYKNVYKVTDYKNPFDKYRGQDIILFDEFRDSIPLSDMLQYLDGYPTQLPARYGDKTACYTKVYIVSNMSLSEQFKLIQKTQPDDWSAFVRRFSKVMRFEKDESDFPFSDDEPPRIIEEDINKYRW